jgi:hypothetical protein
MKIAATFISVQVAWLACAYGAVVGAPSIGVVSCVLALGLGLVLTDQRRTLVLLSGFLGFYGLVTESVLASMGVVRYASPGPYPGFAPLWIVTLWMAFSALIYPAFGWFSYRPMAAAILGATMAPLSYLAADRFGALNVSEPTYLSLLCIGVIWAVALPGAIYARMFLAQHEAS